MLKKIRSLTNQYPIPAALVAFVAIKLLILGIGKLYSFFPVSLTTEFVSESILMLVPVAIVFFFGFAKAFQKGNLLRGLVCSLPFLVMQVIRLVIFFVENVGNPEANWMPWYVIVLGVFSVIGIAVREECIYRATIQNIIAKKYANSTKGIWLALIISSLIFGLTHITNLFFGVHPNAVLTQLITATSAGIFFGAVYLRSGSIWSVILLHAVTDLSGLSYSTFLHTVTDVVEMSQITFSWAVLIDRLIYVALAIFLLRPSKCKQICESFCFADEKSEADTNTQA